MPRLTMFLYNMIVFMSFVRSAVPSQNSSNTIHPSPSTTFNSNSTTTSFNPTSTPVATQSGISTTPTPSSIAPTTTDNVAASSPSPTETLAVKKFEAAFRVEKEYLPAYKNLSSTESVEFIGNLTGKLRDAFRELSFFKRVNVTSLSNGSVVVAVDVIFGKSSNASVSNIESALKRANDTGKLGYTLIGGITVEEVGQLSTVIIPSATATGTVPSLTAAPTPSPTSSTKGTEIWDKAIDLATPLGTFIIVIVTVALVLVLLIALICVCCKYRSLKKKTRFPDHVAINDTEWIRSNDDLLMWERNLRASEVKTNNGVSNRPYNDKRP